MNQNIEYVNTRVLNVGGKMKHSRIPDEIIEQVLKQHDIADVVGKYVHLAKSGHYLKGLCPFHSEKTPSFTVTPEKQIYYCYGCHAGGNAIHFLMEIEGFTFIEAVKLLADEAGIALELDEPTAEQTKEQQEHEWMRKGHEFAANLYGHVLRNYGKDAFQYLKGRGFSESLMDTFQLGFAAPVWDMLSKLLREREYPLSFMEQAGLVSKKSDGSGYIDRFRNRIIFPICDARGRVIAFAARSMGDDQPKYLNSPETPIFNKSQTLYNLHMAKTHIRKQQTAVLFEGYADVIRAWDAGINNGLATMGTAVTDKHALILHRYAEEVILCYDGDDAGQNASYKNLPLLEKAGLRVKVVLMPNKMDPDEFITKYGSARFEREIAENAVSALKFRLIYSRKNYKLNNETDRLRYIREALRLIADISSPTEREHYIRELATEFGYAMETLKQEMMDYRLKKQKNKASGDIIYNSWNNVRNNGKKAERRTLFPAYHNAERHLLAIMMQHKHICETVKEKLGAEFNVDAHAALAAYLYAYYAEGYEPDISRYIAELQDERLAGTASEIISSHSNQNWNNQVIEDYIHQIKKYPIQQDIKQKKEKMVRAERAGDFLQAAQIASEIITLERGLKG